MAHFEFKKGLNLPVSGAPEQVIGEAPHLRTVALLGADYIGLKPRLSVEEGDRVAAGTPIFAHKDTPEAVVVAPVGGTVKAINRGERRVLISVEIEVDHDAKDAIDFSSVGNDETADGIAEKISAAGFWPSFRTRPYSKVPGVDARPEAIFITAMDTEPLAPSAELVINDAPEAFAKGVEVIAKLSEGSTYLCHGPDAQIPGADVPGVVAAEFSGPHPAGLPGTHIHFLDPPRADKTIWTIWYQDVIAIGRLFLDGKVSAERIIALSGPLVERPRLIRTLQGASMVRSIPQCQCG